MCKDLGRTSCDTVPVLRATEPIAPESFTTECQSPWRWHWRCIWAKTRRRMGNWWQVHVEEQQIPARPPTPEAIPQLTARKALPGVTSRTSLEEKPTGARFLAFGQNTMFWLIPALRGLARQMMRHQPHQSRGIACGPRNHTAISPLLMSVQLMMIEAMMRGDPAVAWQRAGSPTPIDLIKIPAESSSRKPSTLSSRSLRSRTLRNSCIGSCNCNSSSN
mmetsp:Transcript_70532/g.147698  ORF Transcript_70532/g.147698 Transcript_70532/m.147698 type:complete len:219 (+) Transcript_70532:455-1111(+)